MLDGRPFETNGHECLKTLAAQEAIYESASKTPKLVSFNKTYNPQITVCHLHGSAVSGKFTSKRNLVSGRNVTFS
jgi:hypothetical protein